MKPKNTLRSLLFAGSSLLTISYAHADTIYWDGTSTSWNAAANWSTASGAAIPDPGAVPGASDDAIFNITTVNTAQIIGLAADQLAQSLTFNSTGTTTIRGNVSGTTTRILTIGSGGITVNSGAGTSSISGSSLGVVDVTLSANQTWINNSTNALNVGTGYVSSATDANVILGANQLTIDGSGNTNIGVENQSEAVLTGSGALVKNGTGRLLLGSNNPGFSGNVTLNNGVLYYGDLPGALGTGNLLITNGTVESRWNNAFTRAQGIGAGQIQITGGTSGFSSNGNTATFNMGTSVTWGSSTFNPAVFVLQSANAGAVAGIFSSNIILDGTDRTIRSDQTAAGTGTFSGVISDGSGTAGIIKTGVGHHILSNAANTFSGVVTINAGTLTARVLANGGLNSSIGSSSNAASNLMIADGATFRYDGTGHSTDRSFTINGTAAGHGASLDASGSGAINYTATGSPAYGTVDQTRTLTLTGTSTGNNTLAANIANNGTGAVSVTKTGTGLWILSNASNSYTGPTTLTAGTLSVGLAGNLGDASSNLVFNGGTLQITGTGLTNFASLGRTVTFNSGMTVSLDIASASNVFTVDQTLNQGTGGLTKLGAGTLVINSAHTYTGLTTISGGTLRLDDGGAISDSMINNGVFLVNKTGAVTMGTDYPALIVGSGSIAFGASTTQTITTPDQLQFNALNTTGGGAVILSGVTTPIFGGLSGATGDLATVITSGYGSVTNLTLNTPTGTSYTYGGVIADGATGMSVTKTGAGTQILTGANSYTGATIVNAGTLTIGAGGSLSTSSALQMGGGTFSYGNTSASQTLNGLTVGASNSTVSNTAAAQTLTLGAITRTGSIFGTVNFATLTGPISTTTGNTSSIIGPWATTGATTTLRYAVGSGDGITPTNISALTGTTATANTLGNVTDATVNYEYSAAVAGMPASTALTGNTLRYSGGATGTAINATSTLTLNGLMQAGTGLLTISGGPSTGGILIGSTGELVIAANAQPTTISAAIGGTGRLVYSGAGTLLLSSTTSNYSGGTVINAGQLRVASDAALGNSTGSITLNGGTFVGNSTNPQSGNTGGVNITSARDVIVGAAGGSMGAHGNNNFTTTGKLSGSGTLTFIALGGAGGRALNFNATNNDFTGRIIIESNSNTLSVNSLLDTAGSGNIALNLSAANNGSVFAYGTGGTTPLMLNNRAFELNASGAFTGTIQNNNTTQAISIGSNLIATGAGAKTLTLNAASGPNNEFGGAISNGSGGGTVALAKSGVGTWVLDGANSYTGATTISAGTLAGIGANAFGSTSVISIAGAGTLSLRGDSGNTSFVKASDSSAYDISTTASLATINVDQATIAGTGAKTMSIGNIGTSSVAVGYQVNFSGANNTSLSVGTVTGAISTAAATVTLSNTIASTGELTIASYNSANTSGNETLIFTGAGTTNITGAITPSTTVLSLQKSGTGTTILSGSNSYTGTSLIAAGILSINSIGNVASGNSALGNPSNATNGIIRLGNDANTGTLIYTGGIASTDRQVQININNNTATGSGVIRNNGGTLTFTATTFNPSYTNTQSPIRSLTLGGSSNGVIEGTMQNHSATSRLAVIKEDAGTWTLENANTYTGATTVSAGTLSVTGSLGDSAVSVNAGTLSGNGDFGGNVTIASGATHALAVAASAGAQDTTIITGTLAMADSNLDLSAVSTPAAGEYVLATATVGITGMPTNIDYNGITGTVSVDTVSTPKRLLLTVTGGGGDDYSTWATDNGIGGEPFEDDFDDDGISNGVEYALGLNPTTSSQPAGVLSGNTITFTKGADAIANDDVSWIIETSTTLEPGSWTDEVTQLSTDNSPTIAYTFTPGSPAKKFARLKVEKTL